MNSIDKLREYGARFNNSHDAWSGIGCEILEIADEIEREVKELADERDLLKTQWEAGVDFDQRLESCAENREDVTLFGVDYMAYPLDADGVPIHVGDVMEWVDEPGITRTVTSIQLANDGWWVYISGTGRRPDKYRHHHAPTVEDVLREFASDIADVLGGDDFRLDDSDELFAEYAAKLRLAGDE